jgi:microcystin-dependent protein
MLAPLNMGTFKIVNAAPPTAATDLATKAYVDAGVSPGFIMAYALDSSAPLGWLICNGASLSTTTYANLFAVIGYTYGGSGANFNVPDFRGCFLRGFDDGRGLDFQGSRAANAYQASYLSNHFHAVSDPTHNHSVTDPSHVHGATTGSHNHSVSDPGHSHNVPNGALTTGVNLQPGSGFNMAASNTTSVSGSGISIVAVGNIGVTVFGAFTGINSTNYAGTGVTVGNVSTGNINMAATETTVQNYPILWCIKY